MAQQLKLYISVLLLLHLLKNITETTIWSDDGLFVCFYIIYLYRTGTALSDDNGRTLVTMAHPDLLINHKHDLNT
jgi:hypothetical protein